MVRLTDRPDMTLDVYRGRKTTIQKQQSFSFNMPITKPIRYVDDYFYEYGQYSFFLSNKVLFHSGYIRSLY